MRTAYTKLIRLKDTRDQHCYCLVYCVTSEQQYYRDRIRDNMVGWNYCWFAKTEIIINSGH